ncbi:MAG: hypothetical protein AAF656_12740 [Planctomycetota bacterium]
MADPHDTSQTPPAPTAERDTLDALDAELALLAAGELDDRRAEALRQRMASDAELHGRYRGLVDDTVWLNTQLDAAETDRPVRLSGTLRAVRRVMLEQPTSVVDDTPRRRLLSGVPTWALSSAAAAVVIIGAVLYWGLREGDDDFARMANSNFGNGSFSIDDGDETTVLQRQVEWAFGIGDGFDFAIDADTDTPQLAMGVTDDLAYDLADLDDTDFVDQWLETYQ